MVMLSEEIAKHLECDDEAVRLGAVRYLLLVGSGAKLAAALEHAFDKSQRVRLATIQLASKRQCREVDDMLALVAARPGLETADRILALEGLRDRPKGLLLAISSLLIQPTSWSRPS